MRITKFKIGKALVLCVLTWLLVGGIGLVSITWAKGKPHNKPPKYHIEYGYTMLRDDGSDVVRSDDGRQYVDKHIADGEDLVEIRIYDGDNALYRSDTFMGEVENQSTRKVNFFFDFLQDATEITVPNENRAVYDILVWTDGTRSSRRGNLVDSKYCLNNDMAHLRVAIVETRDKGVFKGQIVFVVDAGWDGTAPNAITQTTVNNFYGDDQDVNYGTNTLGHIIYYLDYDNGFTIEGEYPMWVFTPNPGPVRLTTTKYKTKGKNGARFGVPLANYDYLPFQFTVSLNDLNSSLLAPRKYNTSSTIWGEIKGK